MSYSTRLAGVVQSLAIIVLALGTTAAFATTRIELNGPWQFRTDPANEGANAGWAAVLPSGTESVQVPHTWNIGKYEDYTGHAWYFKSFRRPQSAPGQHVELHFGATFYKSRVWLNGKELGVHEGGYTEYHFDITPYLQESNFLAVQLDNRPGPATIPGLAGRFGGQSWYDWWHYGGIVRDVWLTITERTFVRRQMIRSVVASDGADVTDTIFVENAGRGRSAMEVTAEVQNASDSSAVGTVRQRIVLKPGENRVPLKLSLKKPRLWSFDQPNLYRMVVTVRDRRGNVVDENSDSFGVRTIEIRDRHLYLNGERVRLSGMTRHEESPWEGLAESRGTMLHDYDDLKNLQVTLTRPVHYPQHPFILDYADRNGILMMPEIPLWQFTEQQLSDPKVIALAKQQMREMIEQAGNHPSIFAWSVCNESETHKPGGLLYFKAMKAFVNEIDPGRFVTYADNNLPDVTDPKQNAATYADFIMMNQYFGTWFGPRSGLVPALEKVNRDYPDKMVIISEMGAAGFFGKDEEEGDRVRTSILREQLPEFAKRDWIAGAIFWCYQDYRSHNNLWPGLTKGLVSMGVVDANRQRRPSYEAWRELNFPAAISAEFNEYSKLPTGLTITVSRRGENELPSYSLRDYRIIWELRDDMQGLVASGEKSYPELNTETISATWSPRGQTTLTLRVRVVRPTGFVAAEKSFEWRKDRSGRGVVEHVAE